jgi:hypothetical protein
MVTLDVAVLEIPVSDPGVLATIWSAADEQIVPADRRARLEDNGFRVGIIGGIPPAAFLNALMSDKTNPAPHQWLKKAGDAKLLTLGGLQSECRFQLVQDGATTSANFDNAQCALQVTPNLLANGVTLQIAPQIQHGKRSLWPATDPEGGWSMQGQRPVERYGHLQFEVTLGATEYLVVGMRDKPNSLGQTCFKALGDRPVERLLAIRASRPAAAASQPLVQNEQGVPPLAAQAAESRARGSQWR